MFHSFQTLVCICTQLLCSESWEAHPRAGSLNSFQTWHSKFLFQFSWRPQQISTKVIPLEFRVEFEAVFPQSWVPAAMVIEAALLVKLKTCISQTEASFTFSFLPSPSLSHPSSLLPFLSFPPLLPFPFLSCLIFSKGRLEEGAQDGILCP